MNRPHRPSALVTEPDDGRVTDKPPAQSVAPRDQPRDDELHQANSDNADAADYSAARQGSSELEFDGSSLTAVGADAGQYSAAEIADAGASFGQAEFEQLRKRLFGDVTPQVIAAPVIPAPRSGQADDSFAATPEPWVAATPTARALLADPSADDAAEPPVPMLPVERLPDPDAGTDDETGSTGAESEPDSEPVDDATVVEPVDAAEAAVVEETVAEPVEQPEPAMQPEPAVQPEPRPSAEALPPMFAGLAAEPADDPSSDSGRRPWWLLAAVLVLVLIGAGGWWAMTSGAADDDAAAPEPRTAPVVADRSPGVASAVSIGPALTLQVSQHVVLDAPASTVTLTMPDRRSLPSLSQFDPLATGVSVVADGQRTSAPGPLAPGDSVTLVLPAETAEFDLVYTASGAVQRSTPSAAQRGAAMANPLSVEGVGDLPVTTVVQGATNLGCITATDTRVCGSGTGDGWSVTQRADAAGAGILAQVDLPR